MGTYQNLSNHYQIYQIKGNYQQYDSPKTLCFDGKIILNEETGLFEGIVKEAYAEDKMRKCYVVGDLYHENGIALTKMTSVGPKRKSYFFGIGLKGKTKELFMKGEWQYAEEEKSMVTYQDGDNCAIKDQERVRYSHFVSGSYCYGGLFSFELTREITYEENAKKQNDNIHKFKKSLEPDFKRTTSKILEDKSIQQKREAFYEVYATEKDKNNYFNTLDELENQSNVKIRSFKK